jgi:hypothetical protein
VRLLKANARDQIAARVMPATGRTIVWLDDTTYLSGSTEDVELYIVELLRRFHRAQIDVGREHRGVLPCDGSTMPAA